MPTPNPDKIVTVFKNFGTSPEARRHVVRTFKINEATVNKIADAYESTKARVIAEAVGAPATSGLPGAGTDARAQRFRDDFGEATLRASNEWTHKNMEVLATAAFGPLSAR